jgi:two-component system cell cycle response regulator DivK
MDIQMPHVSGLDLIEAAKADPVLRSIPVLAVTAYAGKGDEERIRHAGADGYLAKPVSIGPFMAAVRGLVGPSDENAGAGSAPSSDGTAA